MVKDKRLHIRRYSIYNCANQPASLFSDRIANVELITDGNSDFSFWTSKPGSTHIGIKNRNSQDRNPQQQVLHGVIKLIFFDFKCK